MVINKHIYMKVALESFIVHEMIFLLFVMPYNI